jgi:hypothetical protein
VAFTEMEIDFVLRGISSLNKDEGKFHNLLRIRVIRVIFFILYIPRDEMSVANEILNIITQYPFHIGGSFN